ncbi:MAG TPA: hypothetical protein VEK57_26560 [Thermoanaerobaculia bacterium]|nr:hypothetical protein [Thermoanaerobaculia bacterium]
MTSIPAPPAPSNVQGLIVRGYTHPYSTHMLFHFPSRGAAAAFVQALLPYLQSGEDWGDAKPVMLLNISLTCNGIQAATALTSNDLVQFPITFRLGPESSDSQQALFDLGGSAPANWWAKNFKTADLHCVVHTYALDAASMDAIVTHVANAAQTAGVTELFALAGNLRLVQVQLPDEKIHFGYRDGISEPALSWPVEGEPYDSSTLDNFVIGYPTGSPFAPGPSGNNAAGQFAKDGCYNAFRIIAQDVAGFEKFLDDTAPAVTAKLGMSTADAREWIAAKLVGRWRNGSPLEISPDAPDPATCESEGFGYLLDMDGMKCPFAAHTRVSNPRDQQLFPADEPVPRIIRRGAPYGAPADVDPNADRGLIGLFLCGALAAQFELVYGWMNQNTFSQVFSPNFDTQDAVLANRQVAGVDTSFTMPTAKGAIQVTLPQFLTTRGTAYCLLPSIASLEAVAAQAV